MTEYENRQNWDHGSWPEFDEAAMNLQRLVYMSPPGIELNLMVFTVASLAAGCKHCQAHGGFGLTKMVGTPKEKVLALWNFENSELFNDRERAALRFGLAGGSSPNGVTPDHHAAIREHFSDEEARTLLAVVAMSGLLNRFNDTLAVVTDSTAADWAEANLVPLGWSIGKHVGADHERRADLPVPE